MTDDEIRLELFAAKCAELSIKLKNLQEDYKKAGETWEHLCKEKDEEISILQGKLDAYKMSENEANEIIVELKTENAELKKLVEHWHYNAVKRDELADVWFDTAKRYEKTLQEIKEIAEFHTTQADSEDVQEDMKQIIALITKAEVGE